MGLKSQNLLGLLVAASLLSSCGDIDSFAEGILYPTSVVNKTAVPDQPPAGYGQALLKGSQGNTHLWFYTNSSPNAPVIIYYHGNGENLGTISKGSFLKLFEGLGGHFVVADFPGYGKSTGTPSQASLTASAEDVFNWTKAHFSGSKIIIFGWSTGSSVATASAFVHQHEISGLVLASVWTSAKAMAFETFPSLAGGISEEFFKKNTWDNLTTVAQIHLPSIVLHGRTDPMIPFKMGEDVAKALGATFFPIDKGHNDIFQSTDLWNHVKEYVQSR